MEHTTKLCGVDFKSDGDGSHVTARISTTSPDREGDVVLPSGLKAGNYNKNPVVLLQHDKNQPIGRATSLRTTRDGVIATMQFAERPKTHPDAAEWMPDTVKSLMQQGVLSAFSIGFRVPAGGVRAATEKDMDRFGEGTRNVITDWELLEFSVVSIPANQDALAIAVEKGYVPDGPTVRKLGLGDELLRAVEPANGRRVLAIPSVRMLRVDF